MAADDRILEAAYISPGGRRFTFQYEDVSRSFDKLGAEFTFPDSVGTYVQDLGRSGHKYPLIMFFNGDDHDLEANAFEAALGEAGVGAIEHPRYGHVPVVPLGAITRTDNLKSGGNQASISVTLLETIEFIFPALSTDPAAEVTNAIDEYNTAKAQEFEDQLNVGSEIERVTFESRYSATISDAKSGLDDIANQDDSVFSTFNNIHDSIINSLDLLVGQPLALALQTSLFLQTPALAGTQIGARLDAYRNLLNVLIASVQPQSNSFQNDDLFASGMVTGSVVSVVNTQFETKTQAITAAEEVITQMDALTVWRDDSYEALEQIDTGAAYQQLQNAVALAAGFLVQISFTLKQERRVVLQRARTIIDLAAQYYPDEQLSDDSINFVISSNNLSGLEYIEIPAGTEFIYFE